MRRVFLCICFCFLSACSMVQLAPPELVGEGSNQQLIQQCRENYVQGDWQFVHSITFEMANGYGATVIGVTVLDDGNVKTGLMGVEGFVLFEAELDRGKNLDVRRALPPFDNAEFAAGLMRDVQAVFLLPQGENPVAGYLPDGESVCRYTAVNGKISDFIFERNGTTSLYLYDVDSNREKSITADKYRHISGTDIPEKIQLIATGLRGYSLEMLLISAERF